MSEIRDIVIGRSSRDMHSPKNLARFAFAWAKRNVPSRLYLLALRPLEFELSAFISDPHSQPLADAYIAAGHEDNLWLRRTPLSPKMKVVRFSDFTSSLLLHKSDFYQRILRQRKIEYGAAVCVWNQHSWLASLRFLRTREQGDFTNTEMNYVRRWQPVLAQKVTRLAQYQENRMTQRSLEKFVSSLPMAFAILNWNLKVQFYNRMALDICHWWRNGSQALFLKRADSFSLPDDILSTVRQMQALIQKGKPSPSSFTAILSSPHTDTPERFHVHINYEPSKSLTLSRGFFQLHWKREIAFDVHNRTYEKLKRLTNRERECAKLLSSGKVPADIARQLGTSAYTVRNHLSSIYQKLELTGQVQLISFFARLP